MSYIVGIDFGTHQTKICIEETFPNGLQRYEFFEFPFAPKNANALLLPSIIQINQDDTISYGFVDETKAKMQTIEGITPPQKEYIAEPIYLDIPKEPKYDKLPPKPQGKYVGYLAVLAKLLPKSSEEKQWENKCREIEKKNQSLHSSWLTEVEKVKQHNKVLKDEWEQKCKNNEEKYRQALNEFQNDSRKCIPLRFRYFKQATFIHRSIWQSQIITPEQASILYLAYIRFLLNDKIGNDYITRIGVPCSYININEFKQRAYNLWYCAGELVERYKTLSGFLKTSYHELLNKCVYKHFEIDNTAPFDVRTEAQAGLFAVVANRRIETRINLLFDIGGGTTDIAAFNISPDNNLQIMDTLSVPIGLNFIFEKYNENHPELSIESIQQLYSKDTKSFSQYIQLYVNEIKQQAKTLSDAILSALKKQGFQGINIFSSLHNNPSVYCGGGAINIEISILYPIDNIGNVQQVFADRRIIDGNLLGINKNQLVNRDIDNRMFLFFATAYGLSLSDNWFQQPSQNILETFYNAQNQRPVVNYITLERNDDD